MPVGRWVGTALVAVIGMVGSVAAAPAPLGGVGSVATPRPVDVSELDGPTTVVVTDEHGPVVPDPAFLEQFPGDPCVMETAYEKHLFGEEPRYGADCKRIHFAFGPIPVKPGQNDAIIEPVDIEQPRFASYIVRFKPDLVRALDGSKPRTEDLHLHHATWLNLNRDYGDGPFFAAGEEKTIATFPMGYGVEVRPTDVWGLLYMVHNATAGSEGVWLTYSIDVVSKDVAEQKYGMTNARTLWLDVHGNEEFHPEQADSSANPVFNVQRGFGHRDHETGTMVCRWPDENCARFDQYGNVTAQQGLDVSKEVRGTDYVVPEDMAGDIIMLGGHMHPGGIRDEISLVRNGKEKPIFISDAIYWDYDDPRRIGGRPHSWNLSMTVSGIDLGWKVKVRESDRIRINAVQDSQDASWYENMGIVVAAIVPEGTDKPKAVPGIDPFADNVVIDRGYSKKALVPPGPFHYRNGFRPKPCQPDLVGKDGEKRLCLRGQPTHGAIPESGNGGDPCTPETCPPLPEKQGPMVTSIHSVGFTYGQADFGVIGSQGIPRVKLGKPVQFVNEDAAARIWHTFTRCKEPCTGPTKINYPLADGGKGPKDHMDFESLEIGFGLVWEPAKTQVGQRNEPYDHNWAKDAFVWEFTPNRTGTFTFWCRIHPSMRGAFQVVE